MLGGDVLGAHLRGELLGRRECGGRVARDLGRGDRGAGGLLVNGTNKNAVTFETELPAGEGQVEAAVSLAEKKRAAHHVELEYLGPAKK